MYEDGLWSQLGWCIYQNGELWEEIHGCIRNNALQLLAKKEINLNSFNLSRNRDTILHSAAKSNDVKMQFILQRLSPSTQRRMLKMKNKQQLLPSDLLTVWTPSIHSLSPLKFKQLVKAVLMLGAKRQDGTLLPSNSLLQTTQRSSLHNSTICIHKWTT
jgi:hypothetical protein